MMRRVFTIAFAALAMAAPAAAQTPQRLLALARADLDEFNSDSARARVMRALGATLTPAERLRAFTLLAFAEIGRKNTGAARDAFVAALGIEPTLSIDSLKFIESESVTVFALAKTIAAANAPRPPTLTVAEAQVSLSLNVFMPRDTLISAVDARYLIGALPTLPADVVASVLAADAPSVVVWADTLRPNRPRPLAWPLKNTAGQFVQDGRYILRLQANDSTGRSTSILDYRLAVARVRPDTQPLPAPLEASAFAPETLQVAKRFPRVLLTGGAFAAAVVATPAILGNSSLNSGLSTDPMSFVVAGGVAVASAVRFVVGKRPALLSPENARKNREAREAWQRNYDIVVSANTAAIARAGIRVMREGQ